ncbi:hypothetical protein sr11130 [Sporisorium reilianum SRZ2]|uniref:Mig1 protein n=1 Tax=Sporisorium reilianum (strain SRZ2) TaxID=999809 RepID=E7A2B2_SPORE|nr:hypothetical protein sr11130 [Sporisorium reilianum SRZ2]
MLMSNRSALATVLLALLCIAAAVAADVPCSEQPPVLARNTDYMLHCNATGPPESDSVLLGADIFVSNGVPPAHGSAILAARDADLKAFTPMDKRKPFSIVYRYAGFSLHYDAAHNADCYQLTLEQWDAKSPYRMFVDAVGDDAYTHLRPPQTTARAEMCQSHIYIVLKVDLSDF